MLTVYTKPSGCQQCVATKRFLDARKIAYTSIDITAPENADKLEDLKSRGLLQAPVVVVGDAPLPVQGETSDVWTGFRPDLLANYVALQTAAWTNAPEVTA